MSSANANTATDFIAARQQMGLSRNEMADAMGVYYETLAKWERGQQQPPAVAVRMTRLLVWLHGRGLLDDWLADAGGKRMTENETTCINT